MLSCLGECPATNRYHGTRRTGQRVPGTWHKELRMRISLSHGRVVAIWNDEQLRQLYEDAKASH